MVVLSFLGEVPMSEKKSKKKAVTDYPIQKLLSERWGPYAFQNRPISESDLCSLFEAARWAASSYNEQPWRYLVATKENPDHFRQLLSCLVEANQLWAKNAPVLVLAVVKLRFSHNNTENLAAVHDLGLANANITLEATARGISVHQMIGIFPDRARNLFHIPQDFEVWTGMAIGYQGDPATLPDPLQERDLTPRQRKPLEQFVFSGEWNNSSPLMIKE
jgi:nitroreductase